MCWRMEYIARLISQYGTNSRAYWSTPLAQLLFFEFFFLKLAQLLFGELNRVVDALQLSPFSPSDHILPPLVVCIYFCHFPFLTKPSLTKNLWVRRWKVINKKPKSWRFAKWQLVVKKEVCWRKQQTQLQACSFQNLIDSHLQTTLNPMTQHSDVIHYIFVTMDEFWKPFKHSNKVHMTCGQPRYSKIVNPYLFYFLKEEKNQLIGTFENMGKIWPFKSP
jgi:hypothetical protein